MTPLFLFSMTSNTLNTQAKIMQNTEMMNYHKSMQNLNI